MKILSINTHSIIEENYEDKCRIFADGIASLMPDVIAMQEVNQSIEKEAIENTESIFAVGGIPLKEDNHAVKIVHMLSNMGIAYHLAWAGIKKGYGRYDEGIAILSRHPIENVLCFNVSEVADYENWKTRKVLIARTCDINICSAHLGWWGDSEEPFDKQFLKLSTELEKRNCHVLAGDFNCPDSIRSEGYDLVLSKGWHDAYTLAQTKEGLHTVSGPIAGWDKNEKLRIDYIFLRSDICVKSHATVFDGIRYGIVSDHFGIMADTERIVK